MFIIVYINLLYLYPILLYSTLLLYCSINCSIAGVIRNEFDTGIGNEMNLRTQYLFRLTSLLKWLSNTFNIAIIVVNQVTSLFDDNISTLVLSGYHNDSLDLTNCLYQSFHPNRNLYVSTASVPALGLAWSHCVTTRIILYKIANHVDGIDLFPSASASASASTSEDTDQSSQDTHESCTPTTNTTTNAINTDTTISKKRVMYLQFSPCYPTSYCLYGIAQEGIIDCIDNKT